MRVYELANEMGYSSTEFLELLRNLGVDARSNFSVLEDPTVNTIRETVKAKDDKERDKPKKDKARDKPKSSKERTKSKDDGDETSTEAPPSPQAVAPQGAPAEEKPQPPGEIRRLPGGGGTLVTTIDPAAAAAMTMARSATGPKPKPGGELRRIIPAARL